ncbi:MAG: type II toxin-antitoxin system toxin DNA ADP-ribosyl transferase DarT [Candidatus Acidiferrales bacterium]
MSILCAEKALIFRVIHVENVSWILRNGLHCSNGDHSNPNYVQIGNAELIARRTTRDVPTHPGGTLSDYIPFYFTPFSPMLYNIKTGYNGVTKRPMQEIAVLVSSLRQVHKQGIPFVFTDRHAYLQTAVFYNDLDRLDQIDWPRLQARDFRRDPDDPGKVERYQAEALIYHHLPLAALLGIVCYRDTERIKIEDECSRLDIKKQVLCRPDWYL